MRGAFDDQVLGEHLESLLRTGPITETNREPEKGRCMGQRGCGWTVEGARARDVQGVHAEPSTWNMAMAAHHP
eukprot:CAMPEP_0175751552 /NCGR_PEP_ID=MMETSP0097-20121207/61282_1 /TAXON_ID=311494 /ORGANISM="Alexandrium monilatum, Strain CCMP3105" /LENGTH=72 /DNA_ID=CAMNT_0017060257 /DNA_START=157 /DNA_END=372 /DNA_ORIENTATION=+